MPRTKRKKSESGYYHVMCRGNNKQKIFLNDSDYRTYLTYVKKYTHKYCIELICYCLMQNHLHLLLFDEDDNLSKFMRALNTAYALSFNSSYKRVGKLFQDRFKSEAIDDEIYFKTVFRYILQNPMKAGLCNDLEYSWSSYAEIEGKRVVTNPQKAVNLLGGINKTIIFLSTCPTGEEENMRIKTIIEIEDDKRRMTTAEILQVYNKVYKNLNRENIQTLMMNRNSRNNIIKALSKQGLLKSEISSLLGINIRTVYRVLK